MPVACINCLRFHFGECWEASKQCRRCGEWKHIERYCPQNRQIRCTPGEPLPGTKSWCEMHGLDRDPDLQFKILNALKKTPGTAIWVNGVCIYRGYENSFEQHDERRGRPFEQTLARRRSRSPARSPIRRRRSISPVRPDMRRLRQARSPPRRYRTPSPQRALTPPREQQQQARQPAQMAGSNAVMFRPREEYRPSQTAATFRFQGSPKPAAAPPYMLLQNFSGKENNDPSRQPLGQITNIPPGYSSKMSGIVPIVVPTSNRPSSLGAFTNSAGVPARPEQVQAISSVPQPIQRAAWSSQDEPEVGDPHFVLGIGRGAMKAEILDAFEQRMFEVKQDKIDNGLFDPAEPNGNDVWDESERMLIAARKQLVGF